MGNSSNPSTFLEQLRAQSDAVRKHECEQQRPTEDRLRDIDRELWRAFRWLDEALQHLQVIHPPVERVFTLLGVLAIDSPRYDKGFVTYRRRAFGALELLEHVELFYRMIAPAPIVVRVQPGTASSVEERLRSASLQHRYDTEADEYRVVHRGVFTVAPEINATVRFEPDYRRQRVQVALRNVDRFESIVLDFAPGTLGEPALEDLVHLILGRNNRFLRRAPLAGMASARPAEGARSGFSGRAL